MHLSDHQSLAEIIRTSLFRETRYGNPVKLAGTARASKLRAGDRIRSAQRFGRAVLEISAELEQTE
jgi:hypothetical protein